MRENFETIPTSVDLSRILAKKSALETYFSDNTQTS